MKIILSDDRGHKFATVTTWDKANEAVKAIFRRNRWSDLIYDIFFDDGTQTGGNIDLEPQSFHKPHQNEIFTTHLKTFWGNISKQQPGTWALTADDIQFCKNLLNYLP